LPSFFESCIAGCFAPDNFEQAHDVCGTEEMRPDDKLRPMSRGSDLVNVQRGGIAGENGSGLADLVELGKDFFLQRHAFENRFDDQIHARKSVQAQGWLDELESLVHKLLGEAAAFDGVGVILLDIRDAAIERGLICLLDQYWNTRVGEHHGNPGAHRASANHTGSRNWNQRRVFRYVGDFRNLALGKENVHERLGL
jgi:hypothetical protein